MRLRLLTLVTLLVATLGTLSPAQADAAAPAAAKPKVGQCHQLTARQALADSDPKRAASCSGRHDLQTIAVVTSSTSLAALTEDEVSDLGARLCDKPRDRALGRSATKREQTAYGAYFFAPTAAQIDAGARWFRCDIALVAGSHLAQLPRKRLSRPIIGRHVDSFERRCLTGKYWVTTCTSKHAYRSTDAVVLHTSAYPTGDQLVAAANRACPKSWDIVMPPSELGWEHGNRVAVCYVKTRR
jgi:hypothetical protein